MNIISRYILSIVMTLVATMAPGSFEASAFDSGSYAGQSVLSEGRWAKIGDKESGLLRHVTRQDPRLRRQAP